MSDARDFDSILEECLEALLSEQWSLDDCLSRYPAMADELRPLLQVALLTNRLKTPAISPARVDALEQRLRSRRDLVRPTRRLALDFAPYQKLAAMIALVFLLTLGAGGGAVAASANAMPGDFLYPLKRLWEAIVLALASLNASQDEVWLNLAETRLDEAETLAERGAFSNVLWIDLYEATAQSIILVDDDTAPQLLNYLQELRQGIDRLPVSTDTEGLRDDLLLMIVPADSSGLPARPSQRPQGLSLPGTEEDQVTPSATPSATLTSTPFHTASPTPTITASATPYVSPTSRVPATATDTTTPAETDTSTPTQTHTPLPTPTSTWTPLPLPGFLLTDRPDSSPNGSTQRQTATRTPTLDQTATVRYRDTQAAIYATQTQQAQNATEEVRPDE